MTRKSIALWAALFIAFSAGAQNRVGIHQNTFALQGDSVYVDMTIALNGVDVPKKAFVLLTPYLGQKNQVTMELPSVMIDGRNRYKAYRRLVALKRAPVNVNQVIDAGGKKASQTYRYSVAFAYEPWMSEAGFFIKEDQCECNGPIMPISFELIAGKMENRNPLQAPPKIEVQLNFAASYKVPNPEPVKNRSESGKAYLDFQRGQSAIKTELGNNSSELAKIGGLIRKIEDDPYTTITQVVIDGYASPEGTYATNLTLSGNRANALKNYIRSTYGLKENLFRVTGRGEDWNTLIDMIEESGEIWKLPALDIINSTEIFDGREKKLMDLQGGAPYRWMLENWFPKLRRSDYELKYTVIPFTVEQGKKTIETQPHLMSLNEMFLVADSYGAGSEAYNRVFNIAAQQFPESDIANLNAAANALGRGDSPTAKTFLDKVTDRDAVWENNMGVMYALQGEYDKAADHFAKAKAGGNAEGAANLTQIDKLNAARK